MSRFNNPAALPGLIKPFPQAAGTGLLPVEQFGVAPPEADIAPPVSLPAPKASSFQRFGFLMVAIYLVSGYVNDFSFRLLKNKAYISTIALLLMPVLAVLTGKINRGLRHRTGWLWLFMIVWMTIDVPSSVWRGGSVTILVAYATKSVPLFFFLCASGIEAAQFKTLMRFFGVGSAAVLLACVLFGSEEGGRMAIPESLFFANANELALQLLLNIIFLCFWFFGDTNVIWKIISLGLIGGSAVYMLRTGSRGVFLALMCVGVVGFLLSRKKGLLIAIAVPAMLVMLVAIPAHTRHRLALLFGGGSVTNYGEESSAIMSQEDRKQLLYTSVQLSLQKPIFGVGPGQFPVAVAGERAKAGLHAEWLGTHNSYTQISSECGMPAFLAYLMIVIIAIRENFRVFRQSRNRPELFTFHRVSFCLLLAMVGYAVATFFFHIAYGSYLPLLAGITIANFLAMKEYVSSQQRRA